MVQVALVLLVSLYGRFATEIVLRERYAIVHGNMELASHLRRQRPELWQLCGEVALGLMVSWCAVTALADVHRLLGDIPGG